ncbi:hypothetical protein [uncultured Maribacter sp.]|uniref:hypothetical protein n=1 Tax=uncultured Maribacter sp. TaxID=431308 RepID=UPI002633075C|nr:hypothetical protein [uncultured Maribacter sp.]
MKNSKIRSIFLGILTLMCLASCVSRKSKNKPKTIIVKHRKFSNKSKIPLIENCKNDQTEECLKKTISNLILFEVKKRELNLLKDTLKIGIRINADGTTSVMENLTNNFALRKVAFDVLNSMDVIQPAYFESQKSYKTVSYFWYMIIENNTIVDEF